MFSVHNCLVESFFRIALFRIVHCAELHCSELLCQVELSLHVSTFPDQYKSDQSARESSSPEITYCISDDSDRGAPVDLTNLTLEHRVVE